MGLLTETATPAKEILGVATIAVVADKGYFKIEDIEACEEAGIVPYVPRPQRGKRVLGRVDKAHERDFADAARYDSTLIFIWEITSEQAADGQPLWRSGFRASARPIARAKALARTDRRNTGSREPPSRRGTP